VRLVRHTVPDHGGLAAQRSGAVDLSLGEGEPVSGRRADDDVGPQLCPRALDTSTRTAFPGRSCNSSGYSPATSRSVPQPVRTSPASSVRRARSRGAVTSCPREATRGSRVRSVVTRAD
jgi:hypothetical protein